MADYTYVIDSSFKPFSMQEMLVPFTAYKEAFEKAEEKYDALSEKADKFKYLSEKLPEGSKARDIYEGYAKDLKSRAEDFAQNGLTMNNGRALTSLKRRYSGEIGRLVKADEAMEEEKKLRRSLNAQDSSRLYAMDNLNIDDFLDGSSPNLYSVSGNELYTRGAAAGKAASARVYNVNGTQKTLGGYYLDFAQSVGYDPDKMRAFAENAANIPELAMMADNILKERGVLENLSGYNLQRARQSVINGMIDGAVYSESHSPQRDLGVLSKAEQVNDVRARQQLALQKRGQNISLASQGLTYDAKTGTVSYDPKKDPSLQKASAIAQIKAKASGNKTGGSRSSAYNVRNKQVTMIGAKSGTKYKSEDDDKAFGSSIENLDDARALSSQEYSQLVDAYGNITNENLRSALGNGNLSDYEIYMIPKGSHIESHWYGDKEADEDIYIAIPRESKRAATGTEITDDNPSSEDTNDIPG